MVRLDVTSHTNICTFFKKESALWLRPNQQRPNQGSPIPSMRGELRLNCSKRIWEQRLTGAWNLGSSQTSLNTWTGMSRFVSRCHRFHSADLSGSRATSAVPLSRSSTNNYFVRPPAQAKTGFACGTRSSGTKPPIPASSAT